MIFSPTPNIGGSLRSEKFVKYLPSFGWQASILSLSQHGLQEAGEKYPNVERIPSLTPWNRPYQLTPYGWLPTLFLRGHKLLRRYKYDLIYVSCPPFPQAIVASTLKQFADIPLVVDFRDAWILGPYTEEGSLLKRVFHQTLFRVMERKVLNDTDYLIVNSPSALEVYLGKYPALAGRITVIPNGYDEEDFVDYHPGVLQKMRRMKLLYSGRFYISGRDPIIFLKALRQLIEEHVSVSLNIIGEHGAELPKLVEKLGLKDHVQLSGRIPHKKAIQAMGDCDVLVLYQEPSDSLVTPIAGKTYEYLRAGKAILAIAPPGDNLSIVQQYAARYETVAIHDTHNIVQAIRRLYRDWEGDALVSYMPPHIDYLQQYSREALTSRLSTLFNRLN